MVTQHTAYEKNAVILAQYLLHIKIGFRVLALGKITEKARLIHSVVFLRAQWGKGKFEVR